MSRTRSSTVSRIRLNRRLHPRRRFGDRGNLYVAQPDRVTVFTPTGTFVRTWGTVGAGDGQFRYLADVAVDPAGNVYTVDRDLNRVQKFSSSGAFVATWGSQGSGEGQFSGPLGIAADETGVYVTDTGNARVEKFTADGQFVTQWGSRGRGDGQFSAPTGIAVSPRTPNDVYVVEFLTPPRVQYFRRPSAGGAASSGCRRQRQRRPGQRGRARPPARDDHLRRPRGIE
jgi:DNA-binding beta-propeller fold protein YncE